MRMTEKQYTKEREKLLKFYEKLEKEYIHTQNSSNMLSAIQNEKNKRMIDLTSRFYSQGK